MSKIDTLRAVILGVQLFRQLVPVIQGLSHGKHEWTPGVEEEVTQTGASYVQALSDSNIIKEDHADAIKAGFPLLVSLVKEIVGAAEELKSFDDKEVGD